MAATSELEKEEYPITIFHHEADPTILSEDVTKKWHDNPRGVDKDYPYEFVCTRLYKDLGDGKKGWTPWDTKNIALWSHFGKDATPYRLVLENSQDSVYYIKGNTVLDDDEVTTGSITIAGSENGTVKITELNILGTGNIPIPISWNTDESGVKKGRCVYTSDNGWTVPLELYVYADGSAKIVVIESIGAIRINIQEQLETVEVSGGNGQATILKNNFARIPIRANCQEYDGALSAIFKLLAVRDINGDGIICRYLVIPSQTTISYEEISHVENGNKVIDNVTISPNDKISFDVKQDPIIGKPISLSPSELSERAAIKVITSKNTIMTPSNFELNFDEISKIAEENGATVKLYMKDEDYSDMEKTGGNYYLVDTQLIVVNKSLSSKGENGSDGKDGKDGTSNFCILLFDNNMAGLSASVSSAVAHLSMIKNSAGAVPISNLNIGDGGAAIIMPQSVGGNTTTSYSGVDILIEYTSFTSYKMTFTLQSPSDFETNVKELTIPFSTTYEGSVCQTAMRLFSAAAVVYNNVISALGQSYRLRDWNSVPAGSWFYTNEKEAYNVGIESAPTADKVIEGSSTICPRYYDLVYYAATDGEDKKTYRCLKNHQKGIAPGNEEYWQAAEEYNFIKANAAYIENLAAKSVLAEKILVNDGGSIVAGMINDNNSLTGTPLEGTLRDDIVIFAGYDSGSSERLSDAKFKVYQDGKISAKDAEISGNVIATTFGLIPSPLSSSLPEGTSAWFAYEPALIGSESVEGVTLHWISRDGEHFKLNLTNLVTRVGDGTESVNLYSFNTTSLSTPTNQVDTLKYRSGGKVYSNKNCTTPINGWYSNRYTSKTTHLLLTSTSGIEVQAYEILPFKIHEMNCANGGAAQERSSTTIYFLLVPVNYTHLLHYTAGVKDKEFDLYITNLSEWNEGDKRSLYSKVSLFHDKIINTTTFSTNTYTVVGNSLLTLVGLPGANYFAQVSDKLVSASQTFDSIYLNS